MSDYDLPELPSDDELGITEEDIEKYRDQLADDGPELSDRERKELLGDSAERHGAGGAADEAAKPSDAGKSRKARRRAKKEEKKRARAARKRAKEERRRAKEEQRRTKEQETRARKAEKHAEEERRSAGAAAAEPPDPDGPDRGDGDGPDTPADEPDRGGPEPLAPMPAWRGPATLLFLLILSVLASTWTGRVDPAPADAPESEFSAARAMSLLVDIAREAHPTGSPEHARVRDLLLERLRQLGLEPEVQTTTTLLERRGNVAGDPSVARSATVRNIVARIPGSDPTGSVLITAHYDSRQIAVGAGDDGTGVVAILEAVRALQTGLSLRNDVIVLLTDAEELGLLGARAFVDEHPWMPDVDVVLSFEMRGGGGPSFMFETADRNGWVVRQLKAFDPHPSTNSMGYEVYRRMGRDTDFTPFREAGVQGLNFAGFYRGAVYHQAYDVPENVSPSTLQHHGVHALEGLRHFGRTDLTAVDDANVVYFSVPVLGMVVYDRLWVLAISGLLLLGAGVLLLASRRAGARPIRVVAGVGVAIGVATLAYLTGTVLFGWLTGFHPEYGALEGSAFHSEGWYMTALVSTSLLLVVGAASLIRRWIAPLELAVGAVAVPFLAALALGFVAPLAAMNLQWPVAAAMAAVTIMALLGSRASGLVGWVVFLALVVPVFFILQPVTELMWAALTLELAGGLAVLSTVVFLLCLPLLGSLEAPNRWWAPLTLAAAAAGCLAVGIVRSGPSAEAPAPSTLVYAYEHGQDSAVWATSPDDVSSGDRGTAWARDRVGGAFSGTRDLEGFGYRSGDVPVAPARVLLAQPPAVQVVTDTVIGNARRAVLHVRSRIGAEMLGFHLPGEARPTGINGRPLSNVEELTWIDHWGVPDTVVVLELTMPPGSPIDVHVVEHLLRPEELLGRDAFRRPPELAPDVTWLSDRAMFRYSVAAFADPQRSAGEDIVTPPPDTGVPGEVIEIRGDTLPADTGQAGSSPTDSAAADSGAVVDPSAVDTSAVDTSAVDTSAVDTSAVDTLETSVASDTSPVVDPVVEAGPHAPEAGGGDGR